MKTFTYAITDAAGIHARPAGLLVKEAKKFESKISVAKGARKADLKKLFAVMGLGDRKSTRLNSSHPTTSRMPSSA